MGLPQVRVVVQARMQSSRLPGKVLADLVGHPMLAYTVGRLAASCQRPQVIVATSTDIADEAVVHACVKLGIRCARGSQSDVLARYVAATADLADSDIVIRATADNPLYCPCRTSEILEEHIRHGADYTCIERLSYVVPEVMLVGALRAMSARARDARCREHVTPFFREAKHDFRVHQLPSDWRGLRPEVRLTVDTPEELNHMRAICEALTHEGLLVPLERVYEHLEALAAKSVGIAA